MIQLDSTLAACTAQHLTQSAVRRNSAGHDDFVFAQFDCRINSFLDDNIENCRLEACRYVCHVNLASGLFLGIHIVENDGLDAAETEVQTSLFQENTLELHSVRIALSCNSVNKRSSRISQTQNTRHFVVGLTDSIISCASQHLAFVVAGYFNKISMPA